MQNHLEISSKIQFSTRDKRNWTKSRKYGPIWARPGPLKRAWARPGPLKSGKSSGKTQFLHIFRRTYSLFFGLETALLDSFNVLLSFLAEKWYRTNMKLSQKEIFWPETCEIEPTVWFLSSGFCLLRLGEPSGGYWGNPNGPDAVQPFKGNMRKSCFQIWVRKLHLIVFWTKLNGVLTNNLHFES